MEKCQKREEGDVYAWSVENVLKTLRFSEIFFEGREAFLMRTFFLQFFFLISFQNMKYLTW